MSAMQRRGGRGSGVAAEAAFVLLAILFAAGMFVVGIVVGRATKKTHSRTVAAATSTASTEASTTQATSTQATTQQQTTTAQATTTSGGTSGSGGASLAAGKQVFTSNCSSCHTLKDAGAQGNVGPNLDQLKPQLAVVKNQVIHGGGAMPAFKGTLSDKQITAVAQYVSSVAGK
jgi:mono/diheme cytochrome c family protein